MKTEEQNNTDEAYLVKCCINNDAAAQKYFYNKYAEDMMLLCLRYIVNQEDAKEVLMDGFIAFYKNIGQFTYRGAGSVKAWLKKIVINNCLMHLRKKKDFFITSKHPEYYESAGIIENAPGNLSVKEILKLVHSLPDGYRAVFNLYVFEGMNHREIGDLLHISENTSKSQLSRARAILKKQIIQVS